MKIIIEVECQGAAFDNFEYEIHRILNQAEHKILQQRDREPATICDAPEAADKLLDVNGNTVGTVRYEKQCNDVSN